jgi:uncharacterized membrane protein
VYFEAVDNTRTRVRLTLDFEPEGLVERLGDALDVVERQTVADLDRFKHLVESRTPRHTGEATPAVVTGSVIARRVGRTTARRHDPDTTAPRRDWVTQQAPPIAAPT